MFHSLLRLNKRKWLKIKGSIEDVTSHKTENLKYTLWNNFSMEILKHDGKPIMMIDPNLPSSEIYRNEVAAGSEATRRFGVRTGIFYSCQPGAWERLTDAQRAAFHRWEEHPDELRGRIEVLLEKWDALRAQDVAAAREERRSQGSSRMFSRLDGRQQRIAECISDLINALAEEKPAGQHGGPGRGASGMVGQESRP
jgi:alpha-amylase/alpha-mannosidase (GH57 family)